MARIAAPARATVLVVEDTPSMARLYQAYIEKEGHAVELAATGVAALERLRATTAPEVVVLDLNLPDVNGQEILAEIGRQQLPTSVVVVTADGSLKTAVEAMRAGAYDFIVKPFSADRLNTTIKNALERVRLKSTVDVLEETLGRDRFCGFVGASLPMQAVYRALEAAAPSNATVFVTGESGTGKELCAEAVHQLSTRRSKPFIALNCGAIPKDLIESEIFGHVKGSFTGAVADRVGAAKQADGGTLFLDEICEMQIDLQTKLLRFLQSGTLRAVGGSKLEHVDVRIVCATNRDPLTEVRAGRFREDLYYRLHVVPIEMPPLREREEDVVLIARVLLERYAREESKKFIGFDQGAEAALVAYDWPGNVRELQNVLRHAVVMHDGERLTAQMLPLGRAAVRAPLAPSHAAPAPPPVAAPTETPSRPASATDVGGWASEFDIRPLWQVEKAAVERAIALCHDNIPRAAAFLEVAPSTIYRKKQAWEAEGKS
ncbi:MAG: sigma-54 dependent transcriptional regulator [Geminicoccaceae bacterium]